MPDSVAEAIDHNRTPRTDIARPENRLRPRARAKNNYWINRVDKIVQMELTQDQWVCFDLDDLDLVSPYRWRAYLNPDTDSFYAFSSIMKMDGKRSTLYMHRLILGLDFGDKRQGDHLYHMTLDNRKSQLSIVSSRGNNSNRKKLYSSSYPGVCWENRRSKWLAQIWVDGHKRFLGYFEDELDAAAAYQLACGELT